MNNTNLFQRRSCHLRLGNTAIHRLRDLVSCVLWGNRQTRFRRLVDQVLRTQTLLSLGYRDCPHNTPECQHRPPPLRGNSARCWSRPRPQHIDYLGYYYNKSQSLCRLRIYAQDHRYNTCRTASLVQAPHDRIYNIAAFLLAVRRPPRVDNTSNRAH